MKLTNYFSSTVKIAATAGLTAATLAFATSEALSLTLLSNTGIISSSGDTSQANQTYQVSGGDRQAISFITPDDGAGMSRTLDIIRLGLQVSTTANQTINIALHNVDASNAPIGQGTLIFNTTTFRVSSPTFADVFSFTPTTPIALASNTKYALSFYTGSGSSIQHRASCLENGCVDSPGYEQNPPGSFLNNYQSTSSGSSWGSQSAQRVWGIELSDTATPIPFEFSPSLGILALGGIFGANHLRKQLKSKADASGVAELN